MIEWIKAQKVERDRLLGLEYVERENLPIARNSLENELIKVLIGPRRAGKSVMGLLMLKQYNFCYLNFDDEQLLKITNYDKLLEWCRLVYPGFTHMLLDEVQNLPNWELWVNKLARRGIRLVLTGSNAKLLDGELATHLTGRYEKIEVWPMSYRECRRVKPEMTLEEYVRSGGYPEVVIKNVEAVSYLATLFEATLLKDVVRRYRIRRTEEIYTIAKYLMSEFGQEYSYRELARVSGVSVMGVRKYVEYLLQTYLFVSLGRFDYKTKKQLGYNKKMYVVDTGMVAANAMQNSANWGRLLENMILVEWMRLGRHPGRECFYYKTKNNKEIDLVIKDGRKVNELIQVCWDVRDGKTWKREVAALKEAGGELGCQKLTLFYRERGEWKDELIKQVAVEEFLAIPTLKEG